MRLQKLLDGATGADLLENLLDSDARARDDRLTHHHCGIGLDCLCGHHGHPFCHERYHRRPMTSSALASQNIYRFDYTTPLRDTSPRACLAGGMLSAGSSC